MSFGNVTSGYIRVPSAKSYTGHLTNFCRPLIHRRNIAGHRTDFCGASEVTVSGLGLWPSRLTHCNLFKRKSCLHFNRFLSISSII